MSDSLAIESTMQENRLFPPNPALAAKAWIKSREQYDTLYRQSIDHPETFWGMYVFTAGKNAP